MTKNYPQALEKKIELSKLILQPSNIILQGDAKFVGERCVEVDGEVYEGEHVLVAVGGRPYKPDIPGAELGETSDDVRSFLL